MFKGEALTFKGEGFTIEGWRVRFEGKIVGFRLIFGRVAKILLALWRDLNILRAGILASTFNPDARPRKETHQWDEKNVAPRFSNRLTNA
jgi:hypothetical protein